MSLASAIRETLSPQPRGDELRPNGVLDRMAAFGLVLAGILYIWFDTLSGPIRGVLGSVGLTPFIYLPAGVALLALALDLVVRIGDPRTATSTLLVAGFLAVEGLIALLLGRSIEAVAFEFYICLPIFLMMALTQRRMQDRLIDMMVAMFFIATIGVLLNIFIRFPWADTAYEVMGVQRVAAREWSSAGQNRLAGFSRASYAAAGQILIGFCAFEYRVRSILWRGVCWAVGLVAAYYTTSKSPTLAMALLPGTYFLIGRARASEGTRRQAIAHVIMGFWVLLIFIGPFLSMTFGEQLFPSGVGSGYSYNSLADRILNTWPNAIAMIDWRNPVSWLVGRGFGGIGTPSALFEPPGNPGDNLAIYLFVTFGLASFFLAFLIFRGGQRAIASGGRGRRDFAMMVAMLGVASAANAVEATITAMIVGLAIARQTKRSRSGVRRRSRREPERGRPASAPVET